MLLFTSYNRRLIFKLLFIFISPFLDNKFKLALSFAFIAFICSNSCAVLSILISLIVLISINERLPCEVFPWDRILVNILLLSILCSIVKLSTSIFNFPPLLENIPYSSLTFVSMILISSFTIFLILPSDTSILDEVIVFFVSWLAHVGVKTTILQLIIKKIALFSNLFFIISPPIFFSINSWRLFMKITKRTILLSSYKIHHYLILIY